MKLQYFFHNFSIDPDYSLILSIVFLSSKIFSISLPANFLLLFLENLFLLCTKAAISWRSQSSDIIDSNAISFPTTSVQLFTIAGTRFLLIVRKSGRFIPPEGLLSLRFDNSLNLFVRVIIISILITTERAFKPAPEESFRKNINILDGKSKG